MGCFERFSITFGHFLITFEHFWHFWITFSTFAASKKKKKIALERPNFSNF